MKKKVSKILVFAVLIALVFSACGCSDLKITDEMQKAIDIYIDAVSKTELKKSGKVTVTSILEDSAIEFKTTEAVIEFDFEIVDDKVLFERIDYVDKKESSKYKSDGNVIESFDFVTNTWQDKTEENKQFLTATSNPFTSLSLFRIDNKHKIQTSYLKDIKSYEENGSTVVEFILKDSTVSDVLGFYKADGIVRESDGNSRKYYIDSNGLISKIVIFSSQNIISDGKSGVYKTEITVICK